MCMGHFPVFYEMPAGVICSFLSHTAYVRFALRCSLLCPYVMICLLLQCGLIFSLGGMFGKPKYYQCSQKIIFELTIYFSIALKKFYKFTFPM